MRSRRSRGVRAARATAAAAVLTVLSVLTAQADPFAPAEPVGADAGTPYLVTFEAGTSSGEQHESREEVTDSGGAIRHTYTKVLRGFAADLPPEAVAELRADPDVRSVTPDPRVSIDGGAQSPAPWNLDRIDQRPATRDNTFSYDGDGAGITVYVLDTGIRADHVEFGGRVRSGFSAVGGSTEDCNGHGTHVAGIIGSATYGVAKGVDLVPVRVLGCDGSGAFSQILAGLDWVLNHQVPGRSVVNMSLGAVHSSRQIDDAVASAVGAAGLPVVVAAGNENIDACRVTPARAPSAITVGAVTAADTRWVGSNYGTCVDVFAPGAGITSADSTTSTSTATATGTSMAAPHVAGVVATLLQGSPGARPDAVRDLLGRLFTTGGLTGLGSGSPNALLYAPPRLRLAGVGSQTVAPFLAALGDDAGALASRGQRLVQAFATTGTGSVVTQDPATVLGCSLVRPASQAAARAALLASLATGSGCLQFAWAESLDRSPATSRLVYVPFAQENVTVAITNTSNLPANRTFASLRSLYRCEGAPSIRPMLPQAGSGLREFWITQMYPAGFPTLNTGCLQNGMDEFGLPIPPNAGGGLNDSELVPVSVAQWTTQAAGIVPEQRGRTRIAQIDGQNPFATGFGLQRELYVVIPESALESSSVLDVRLRAVFVGINSLLCSAVSCPVGVRYGFSAHLDCGSTWRRTL